MKTIDTSNISSSLRMGYSKGSIDQTFESIKEGDDALAQALIPSYVTGDVVILRGCVNSGSSSGAGNPFSVSAGAVYYNGEIYQVAAISGNFTGTNVIVGTLNTTTYRTGDGTDPALYDDLVSRNSHPNRIFVLSEAAAGSGTKDHTAFKRKRVYSTVTDDAGVANVNSGSWTVLTTMTYTTPNDGLTRYYRIQAKVVCTPSNGVNDADFNFRLRNTSDSLTYDTTTFRHNKATNTDVVESNAWLDSGIISIGANKTIEFQREWIIGSMSFTFLKLYVEEIATY